MSEKIIDCINELKELGTCITDIQYTNVRDVADEVFDISNKLESIIFDVESFLEKGQDDEN